MFYILGLSTSFKHFKNTHFVSKQHLGHKPDRLKMETKVMRLLFIVLQTTIFSPKNYIYRFVLREIWEPSALLLILTYFSINNDIFQVI